MARWAAPSTIRPSNARVRSKSASCAAKAAAAVGDLVVGRDERVVEAQPDPAQGPEAGVGEPLPANGRVVQRHEQPPGAAGTQRRVDGADDNGVARVGAEGDRGLLPRQPETALHRPGAHRDPGSVGTAAGLRQRQAHHLLAGRHRVHHGLAHMRGQAREQAVEQHRAEDQVGQVEVGPSHLLAGDSDRDGIRVLSPMSGGERHPEQPVAAQCPELVPAHLLRDRPREVAVVELAATQRRDRGLEVGVPAGEDEGIIWCTRLH